MSVTLHELDAAGTHERDVLLALAIATGRFDRAEAERLLGGILDAAFAGTLEPGHSVLVLRDFPNGRPIGWSYHAPDAYADGVWNLWWIGIDPAHHGRGAGTTLLRGVEQAVSARHARVLVIETSDLPPLARARRFYEREGYEVRGTIPDFYGAGDGKVILSRTLPSIA